MMHERRMDWGERHGFLFRGMLVSLSTLAFAVSGCGPAWYSPPPPMYPPGQQIPPGQLAPVPVPPGTLGTPATPPTFESEGIPGNLNEVPSVPANQVLTLPPTAGNPVWHDVKPGETLTGIAKAYGVTLQQLRSENSLSENYILKTNDMLRIPGTR